MKSKLFTRILLLALALLTVFSLAACNTDKTPEDPTTAEKPTTAPPVDETPTEGPDDSSNETEEVPDLPEVTFAEQEYKIYMRDYGEDGVDYSREIYVGDTLEGNASAVERAVFTRMSDIMTKYGIFFDVKTEEDNQVRAGHVDTSTKTGTDVYDLVVDHSHYLFSYAVKNQLLDLNDLPHNDFEKPWWNQDARESFATMGGRLFGMIGDISYYSVGSAFVMFFNKQIIKDVQGLESPYELVYKDEWTFDVFETYAITTDSNLNGNNSGDILTDCFGYGTQTWRGPIQMLYSTGFRGMVRRDSGWRITINNDTTNRAVNDLRDLLWNSGSAYLDDTGEYLELKNAFISNRVTFFDNHLHSASIFKSTELDFGILPWPMYGDAEAYHTCVDAGTSIYAVPRNTSQENAVKASVILEEMAYLGYKNILPFYYETILSYQYLKDEDSIKMMEIVHDNLIFDRGFFVDGVTSYFREAVIGAPGGNRSLNHIYESNLGNIDRALKAWDDLDKQLDQAG